MLSLQEKFSDDSKEGRSKTLPSSRKSSKVAGLISLSSIGVYVVELFSFPQCE